MPDYLRKHGPAERVTYGTTGAAGADGRVRLYH